ncbi:MAG: CrcB family protein [Pirellulales bacterium]
MKNELIAIGWVAAFGAVGSVLRYLVGVAFKSAGYTFPAWTLVVNVVGCFLLGLLAGAAVQRGPFSAVVHPGVTAGFLGGLTTFSALSVESIQLIQLRGLSWGLANLAVNLALGLLAAWLGFQLQR